MTIVVNVTEPYAEGDFAIYTSIKPHSPTVKNIVQLRLEEAANICDHNSNHVTSWKRSTFNRKQFSLPVEDAVENDGHNDPKRHHDSTKI